MLAETLNHPNNEIAEKTALVLSTHFDSEDNINAEERDAGTEGMAVDKGFNI